MKTTDIIKSFKQGGAGNCVSIAVIKASIQVFGLENVIFVHNAIEGHFEFTMRDGFIGSFTKEELEISKSGSKFELKENQSVYDYANKCFAAMVKRVIEQEHEGADDLETGISALNNGENYHKGAEWLGLRHYTRAIGLKYVWGNIGVVGASKKHCFFCSEGYVDNYGNPKKIKVLQRVAYRFYGYYRIANDPVY